MSDQSLAQTQASTSATTGVFALLKAKAGVKRAQIMAIYLDGKIREWYSRDDGRGGRFPRQRQRRRGSAVHHGDFTARQRALAGSRIHSGRPLMPLRLLIGSQPAKQ